MVDAIRANHPRLGTRKLHFLLQPLLSQEGIHLGRDALFKLLAVHGLLVRKRFKSGPKTTDARLWALQYPDLVNRTELPSSAHLWVSDITYLHTQSGFVYLSLITEVNSRKIIGYKVSDSMETRRLCLPALVMALEQTQYVRAEQVIHHSDRGRQYLDAEYTGLLKDFKIRISMTQTGDPRDNAIAERVNGILKHEYLIKPLRSLQHACDQVAKAVKLYNTKRPHQSLGNKTPEQVFENRSRVSKFEMRKIT